MAPPPNAFSNELGQWVRNKCIQSIVHVELRPKDAAKVKDLWYKVGPIPARLEDCGDYQCCTGFVVKEDDKGLLILTCAHVLGPAFKTGRPINAAKVNDLYDPMILCDHEEQRCQTEGDEIKAYMYAQVVQIACSRDLMLLHVSKQEVGHKYLEPHPALQMAASFPKSVVRVVMLSWPVDSDRTSVLGKVSHHSRTFKSMSKNNPRGFRMKLSQVDITSENGSSGAPLLDGEGCYVGLLCGGNGGFSYFVSFPDLRNVLRHWDVI